MLAHDEVAAFRHLMADVWPVLRGVLAVPPQEAGVVIDVQQLVRLRDRGSKLPGCGTNIKTRTRSEPATPMQCPATLDGPSQLLRSPGRRSRGQTQRHGPCWTPHPLLHQLAAAVRPQACLDSASETSLHVTAAAAEGGQRVAATQRAQMTSRRKSRHLSFVALDWQSPLLQDSSVDSGYCADCQQTLAA